jgi:hypothetical protein
MIWFKNVKQAWDRKKITLSTCAPNRSCIPWSELSACDQQSTPSPIESQGSDSQSSQYSDIVKYHGGALTGGDINKLVNGWPTIGGEIQTLFRQEGCKRVTPTADLDTVIRERFAILDIVMNYRQGEVL